MKSFSPAPRLYVCAAVLSIGVFSSISQASAQVDGAGTVGDIADVATTGAAPSEWRFIIGAGGGVVPDYVGSDDYTGALFPVLRAQKGHIYGEIGPNRFGYALDSNLIPDPNIRLGIIAAVTPGSRDVNDKRVDKVRSGGTTAFGLGAKAGYAFHFDDQVLSFNVRFLHDVSGVNDGFQIAPEINYLVPLGERWRFGFRLSTDYASENYMQEYFGISGKDAARSGLDRFNADAGIRDVRGVAVADYKIDANWNVFFGIGYMRLVGDAKDSPVTDDRGSANQFLSALGAAYTW